MVPNTVIGSTDLSTLWLGPDEWLVVAAESLRRGLLHMLEDAGHGHEATVVDVSAARTTIEVAGPRARELLESGCSIDLHPRAFRDGSCAQTLVARVNVILWQVSDEPRYRLLARPSFGHHLAAWMIDASAGLDD